MKRSLIVLFLAGMFSLTSCGSDDDNAPEQSIEGTWELTSIQPPILIPGDCPQNATLTFNEDHTTDAVFYNADDDCQAESSTGEWQNLGNSRYRVTIPEFGPTEGNVNFTSANRFIFTTVFQGINVEMTFDRQ